MAKPKLSLALFEECLLCYCAVVDSVAQLTVVVPLTHRRLLCSVKEEGSKHLHIGSVPYRYPRLCCALSALSSLLLIIPVIKLTQSPPPPVLAICCCFPLTHTHTHFLCHLFSLSLFSFQLVFNLSNGGAPLHLPSTSSIFRFFVVSWSLSLKCLSAQLSSVCNIISSIYSPEFVGAREGELPRAAAG